jgi:basic amino acid/polyamine antiporter, APA family
VSPLHFARGSSDKLEDELSKIVQERDNIRGDEFDKLIEKAPVIDLERSYKLNRLLQIISEKLHGHVSCDPENLLSMFIKREQEGSTVLIPMVAVPHIVIESKGVFEIVLVRCKSGIKFSEKHKNVKAIIALIGSKDDRTMHLKTLTAIAQIIQDKEFDDKWIKAETPKNLKDIFLLGDRRR